MGSPHSRRSCAHSLSPVKCATDLQSNLQQENGKNQANLNVNNLKGNAAILSPQALIYLVFQKTNHKKISQVEKWPPK